MPLAHLIHSLRMRLLLLVLLISLPVLAHLVSTVNEQRRAVITETQEATWRLIRPASALYDDQIDSARQMLELLAQQPELMGDEPRCRTLMQSLVARRKGLVNVGMLGPDGAVRCSAIPLAGTPAEREFFRRAIAQRGFALGEYHPDPRVKTAATLSMGYPLFAADGTVEAVLFATLDLAWLNQLAAELRLPPGSVLTLIDHRGMVLVRYPESTRYVGKAQPEGALVRTILANRVGAAQLPGLDGVSRLYVYNEIGETSNAPSTYMSIGIDAATAFAPADALLRRSLAQLALAALLMVLLLYIGTDRFVTRRLDGLLAAMRRLQGGELSARSRVKGNDEIGQLGRSFDEMAETLAATMNERTRALEQLREAQRVAHLGNWESMLGFDQVRWSSELGRIYGLAEEPGEGPGARLFERIHPEDRAMVVKQTNKAVACREPFSFEHRVVWPDGSERIVWTQGRVIESEEGPPRIVGTALDVTEHRQAEQALAQARELDQLKSEFVNAVSHELRTPLTTMRGYTEFLEDGIGGELTREQQEFLAQIVQSGTRLERLVDDLLDYARLQAGTFRLRLEPRELAPTLEETLRGFEPQLRVAQIRLETAIAADLPPLPFDAHRIGQVLANLISNAIKFTSPGGRITVRAHREAEAVRLEVSDTGVGIAEADQAKLFRKFSQLAEGVRHGGTGLGLSISKAIVEAHGGAIGVSSRAGEGATFWFTLPLTGPESPG